MVNTVSNAAARPYAGTRHSCFRGSRRVFLFILRQEETAMLNADFAGRFVEQLSTCTDYNINIMDENGIIIASRDAERIHSYHETAHRMLRTGQDIMAVTDDESYPGVRSGVNLLVRDGKTPVGVVGVTGAPQKVQEIALVIKMALESMLRYEYQQQTLYNARTAQERFHASMFLEEAPALERLEALAGELRLSPRRLRVPILIKPPEHLEPEYALERIRAGAATQDIVWAKDITHILICQDLGEEGGDALSKWRDLVSLRLEQLASSPGYSRAFVGTIQCRLHCYRQGLAHCLWLEEHPPSAQQNLFFTDHIGRYLSSLLPADELYGIWNAYGQCLDERTKEDLRQISGPLSENNYNLTVASQKMFIHKNTLAFRINKLKKRLGIDPLNSGADRLFLNCLSLYLKRSR